MASAPSIFGNSGGGFFRAESGDLLGLTSRVTVPSLFGVPDVQVWMEFSSHPSRFYEFFREQELLFLAGDEKDTFAGAMERRDKRQKEALRSLLVGQGDTAPTIPDVPEQAPE